MTRARNPGPPSRSFAPASRSAHPGFAAPASRGSGISFPEPRSRLPGFRAQKVGIPGPKVGIPGPQSRKFGSRDPNSGFARPGLPEVPARRGRMCKAGRKSKPVTEAAISSKDRALLAAWLRAKVKKRSEPLKQPQSRMNAGEVDVLDFKQLCVSRCSLAPATGPPSHPSAPRRTSFTQRRLASALGRDRSTPRGCSPSSRSRDSSSRRTSGRTPTLQ